MFLDILQKLKSEKRYLSYNNVTIIKEKKSLRQNETLVKGAAGQTLLIFHFQFVTTRSLWIAM